MTQLVAFVPPPNNIFSFQPILDGQTCLATTWWNSDSQRWFVTVTGPSGAALFTIPLIGSPYAVPIESLSWANGTVRATTSRPHGFRKLTTMNLSVVGCSPVAYNGVVTAFVTGPTSFTYQIQSDPNEADQLGQVSYDINLGAGYLKSSMFLFREQNQMFEISP